MSDPRWRDTRASRPYSGDQGEEPRGRDTRGPGPRRQAGDGRRPADEAAARRMPAQTGLTPPVTPQPTLTPRTGETPRRAAEEPPDGPGRRRGRRAGRQASRRASRRAGRRPRAAGGRLSRIWEGSLRGGLGACVIVGSAVIGAVATIVTKSQPGSVLGLFVLAGTVAAALTVQPRSGRLIFPVPALSYLIAALTAGVVYDRSAGKTAIAVGAAQWIASGFFVMVLSTLLAIALTTVRWYMWRRDQRGPAAPDRPATAPRPPAGPPRRPGTPPGAQRPQWPPGSPRNQRPGPRPGQRPGSGPYNFSSGA